MATATETSAAADRGMLHRLVSARGHLDAVIHMMENGASCLDVLHQVPAVEGALAAARRELMEHHLRTCVAEAIAAGRPEALVNELLEALQCSQSGRQRRQAVTTT